jgi:hypothetical protein
MGPAVPSEGVFGVRGSAVAAQELSGSIWKDTDFFLQLSHLFFQIWQWGFVNV